MDGARPAPFSILQILSILSKIPPGFPERIDTRRSGITVLPMQTLTFKVTEEEARRIRRAAQREKVSVSEYLRRRAGGPAPLPMKLRKVRCSRTGAVIFAAAPHLPPLTTESVREMLADFP